MFGATFDVYGQWLDAAGNAVGANFKINDTTGPARCASPTVAGDGARGWVVAWIDRRNAPGDPGDVYAQRFDTAGAPVGPNVRVNDDALGRDQRQVHAGSGGEAAALVWEDYRGNLGVDANVMVSMTPYDGSPPGGNFRVNTDVAGKQAAPAVLRDATGAWIAAWEDGRNGAPDVFAIAFFPTERAAGPTRS